MSVPKFHFFRQFNSLVDDHMRDLSATDLKALLAFLRHADTNGIGYPGQGTVAKRVGCSVRNCERAIARLTADGFLRTVDTGGGRNKTARRMVDIQPKTPAQCAGESTGETPAQTDKKPRRKKTANPGANGQETPAQCAPRTTHGTTPLNKPVTAGQEIAGVVSLNEEEESEKTKTETRAALTCRDIAEPTRSKLLSEIPELTAADVQTVARKLNGNYRPGLLISRIRSDGAEVIADRKRADIRRRKALENRPRDQQAQTRHDGDREARPERVAPDPAAVAERERQRAENVAKALAEAEAVKVAEEAKKNAAVAAQQERAKVLADFRAGFSDEAWARLVEKLYELYPATKAIHVFYPDAIAADVYHAVQAGKLTAPSTEKAAI